jgi:hypothetical protein
MLPLHERGEPVVFDQSEVVPHVSHEALHLIRSLKTAAQVDLACEQAVQRARPGVAALRIADHLNFVDHRDVIIPRNADHLHGARSMGAARNFSLLLSCKQIAHHTLSIQRLVHLQRKESQRAAIQTAALRRISLLKPLESLIRLP